MLKYNILVLAQYVHQNEIKKVLLCEPPTETKKAVDIMTVVNKLSDCKSLLWDLVEAICTDSALAMLGKNSGFMAVVKKMNSNVISSHCILHQHALALKTPLSHLQDVFDVVIQVVNLI
jgi:hypothetical protein